MLDGRIMNPDTRFESITGVVIIAHLDPRDFHS